MINGESDPSAVCRSEDSHDVHFTLGEKSHAQKRGEQRNRRLNNRIGQRKTVDGPAAVGHAREAERAKKSKREIRTVLVARCKRLLPLPAGVGKARHIYHVPLLLLLPPLTYRQVGNVAPTPRSRPCACGRRLPRPTRRWVSHCAPNATRRMTATAVATAAAAAAATAAAAAVASRAARR